MLIGLTARILLCGTCGNERSLFAKDHVTALKWRASQGWQNSGMNGTKDRKALAPFRYKGMGNMAGVNDDLKTD